MLPAAHKKRTRTLGSGVSPRGISRN